MKTPDRTPGILQNHLRANYLQYLLFVIYLLLGCFAISKLPVTRASGWPVRNWVVFFCLKTLAGCYYGYWYSKPALSGSADTWRLHEEALIEYRLLLADPQTYLVSLFHNGFDTWQGVFASSGYWNDLKDQLMLKIISLMDLLSVGHYYVNVVIYSFTTCFAFVYLYKTCKLLLQRPPGALTVLCMLLTPSCLFWTSGIHRDGIMLLFISLFFWQCARAIAEKRFWHRLPAMLLLLTVIFFFRNYIAMLLAPATFAMLVTVHFRLRPVIVYLATAATSAVFFFLVPVLFQRPDPPAALINRKIAFEALTAKSRLPELTLKPEPASFARNLLPAMDHALLRPYLWQAASIMEIMAAVEIMMLVAMIAFVLLRLKTPVGKDARHFQWLIIFFSGMALLVIGYTIPFAGAIVRYRSVFLMLITVVVTFRDNKKIPGLT